MKLNDYINEMMVTFTGKEQPTQTQEPVMAPEDNALPQVSDAFTDGIHDMLQTYHTSFDTISPMTHVTSVDNLEGGEQTPEIEVEVPTTEVAPEEPQVDDQIVFDAVDGKLMIKFGNNEIYMDKDAIEKLKAYLDEQDFEESDDSEETEDTENAEDDSEDETFEEEDPETTKDSEETEE